MSDQHYELEIAVRDAHSGETVQHAEIRSPDEDTKAVAQEVTDTLRTRLGARYRPITPEP